MHKEKSGNEADEKEKTLLKDCFKHIGLKKLMGNVILHLSLQ